MAQYIAIDASDLNKTISFQHTQVGAKTAAGRRHIGFKTQVLFSFAGWIDADEYIEHAPCRGVRLACRRFYQLGYPQWDGFFLWYTNYSRILRKSLEVRFLHE
jgi:hypothetical protein